MPETTLVASYGALLLAGLAGSLHCVGMCGPILLGFSQSFAKAEQTGKRSSLMADFFWYHVGRLWTYGLLGLIVGFIGHGVRHGSIWFGWQRGAGIAVSVMMIISGVLLLGLLPRSGDGIIARIGRWLGGCGFKRLGGFRWFKALLKTPGPAAKLMLGLVMGLLPCGLVYAVLVVTSAMPTPWHSALGMVVFGIGTLPSLSAVLIFARVIPPRWRVHGTRMAGVVIIVTGGWMVARSLTSSPAGCPACESAAVAKIIGSPDASDSSAP